MDFCVFLAVLLLKVEWEIPSNCLSAAAVRQSTSAKLAGSVFTGHGSVFTGQRRALRQRKVPQSSVQGLFRVSMKCVIQSVGMQVCGESFSCLWWRVAARGDPGRGRCAVLQGRDAATAGAIAMTWFSSLLLLYFRLVLPGGIIFWR